MVESGQRSLSELRSGLLASDGQVFVRLAVDAASRLFNFDKLAREHGAVADMGATMYLITCPDDPPDELLAPALTVAIDRDIQLMQLTGMALTSGLPVTHAVLQAPPEGGATPEAAAE